MKYDNYDVAAQIRFLCLVVLPLVAGTSVWFYSVLTQRFRKVAVAGACASQTYVLVLAAQRAASFLLYERPEVPYARDHPLAFDMGCGILFVSPIILYALILCTLPSLVFLVHGYYTRRRLRIA